MKKISLISILTLFLLGCQSEKTLVDEIAELRCECLQSHNVEEEDFMTIIDCLNEVNAMEKFKDLGEEEIIEKVKEICPEGMLKEN